MKWNELIVVDIAICHGQPCFKGTRIMVHLILEMFESGDTIDNILKAYPQLTKEHIRAVFHYAAEVIKNGDYVPFAKAS